MIKYVLVLYIIGVIFTYIYTSLTIRNPNDEDRDYSCPPEYDFSHMGAAFIFPLFWFILMLKYLSEIFSNLSKKIYDDNKVR